MSAADRAVMVLERSCKAFRASLGSVAVVVGELFPARRAPYWLDESPAAGAGAGMDPEVGEVVPPTAPAPTSGVLHGVPTFAAIQDILLAYGDAHGELDDWLASSVWRCKCGQELPTHDDGPYRALLEHCTELQASALSFAIQEARNTEPEPGNFWPDELSGGQS